MKMDTKAISPRDLLVSYISEMVQLSYPPSLIGEKTVEFVEAILEAPLPEELK
ncbi:MAG: hypothetical protein SBU_001340 [Candidatus Syntrophoarchaeum butanivorans]|uniref:Uncharacterized protein n=1 Tax=Candidatus Syntropharchaeum butanivorans TaxID=1839936 RepID=A0A1F2P3B2_9EURY|nr:MAG: hypothetical protein SBU_001340 [Candidatus Syntrophoarchaeum butanivorans]